MSLILDEEFLNMINASNLSFDVIMNKHAHSYDVLSQSSEEILEEVEEAVKKIEGDEGLEGLEAVGRHALFSSETVGILEHTLFVRRMLKRRAQEMVKNIIKEGRVKKTKRAKN